MEANGLKLAPEKIKSLFFIKVTGNEGYLLSEAEDIVPKHSVKYLGIWLGDNRSFGIHVTKTKESAERSLPALARLMPNIGGPGNATRIVMHGVIQSIALYGAPVWKGPEDDF